MDVGRTLTEPDTWDKASHSCSRPATVSTPGNGAAPDNTRKTRKTKGRAEGNTKMHEYVRKQKHFEIELCVAYLPEMSGTACSDMWGLCSSSDRLSDRVSPCNLETTRKACTKVYTLARSYVCRACFEAECQITKRHACLYQSEVMRQRGNV